MQVSLTALSKDHYLDARIYIDMMVESVRKEWKIFSSPTLIH
jgi:hypothetical protein